ncbi:MAG: DUF362 domain-containing protein [Candidatus Poribacteria bacterium]
MVQITDQEKQLKIFMQLSALAYFVVGFGFVIMPTQILGMANAVSRILIPGLEEIPMSVEKFWLSMTFSMMMTITAICFIVQHNVRKNIRYIAPLLFSKAASALSALCFFIFSDRYFAYLVILIVDGSIFWITLIFYLRADKAYFKAQTIYLQKTPTFKEITEPTTVVVETGEDKFDMLNKVLNRAGFYDVLEKRFKESGKSKENFSVVIKPNFMYMHAKKDISTYTDPELVEYLFDRIAERGFSKITLVEAQSTLGNYYNNREVLKVAEYIGYSTKKNYRIVDLTEEKVPYDYGGRFGQHFVGPTWRDADFRISFAKNKTHVFCHYTLTLKNLYGTLPMQNKLKEYHTKREYDWPTIEAMKHFPVHFGIIDGIYSADGHFGVITDPTPKHTKTIIGGENLMAVDWVGAKKMGLDADNPKIGRFLALAWEAFGKPININWVGDKSEYYQWQNVSEVFIQSLDIIEEARAFGDWWFSALTAMDKYFPFRKRAIPILVFRAILKPIKRLFFKYDYLGPDIAKSIEQGQLEITDPDE